jgi:DNA polymerase family B
MVKYISLPHYVYTVYLTRFRVKTLYFLSNNLRRVFQPFFTGSKIQITQNIGKNLYFYDVNSMYPYMMLRPLPNKYCNTKKNCNLNTFFGFVFATLIKKPKNKFFTDFKTGIIFSEELKALLILGHSFQYHQFIRFNREYLFTSFVDHFYLIKCFTKSIFLKHISKLFLNSLYGKFSTRASANNALHISIAINSYSRVEMLQYKQKYFIYADTDSIIYKTELANLYIGNNIGLFKLVNKIDKGYFLPNYYMYNSDKKIIIKARGMIKKIFPIFKGFLYNFKLSYFKKRKYTIYLKETFFRFVYSPDNIVYNLKKKNKSGKD